MELRKSAEDYLEAILMLSKQKDVVHSVDVAHYMDFSKPSISRAVNNLKEDGYLTMQGNGGLLLTEKGTQTAERIFERHTILTDLLANLGVPHKIATEDACKIEHVISNETFDTLRTLYLKSLKPGNTRKAAKG